MEVAIIEELRKSGKDILATLLVGLLLLIFSILVFPLLIFFLPCPFIYLSVKRGNYIGSLGILLMTLAVFLSFDIESGFIIFTYLMIVTLIMAYMIKYNYKPIQIISASAIGLLLFIGLSVILMETVNHIDIINNLEISITTLLNNQKELFIESGMSKESLEELFTNISESLDYMIVLLPSVMTIFAFLTSSLNYAISAKYLKKNKVLKIDNPKLYDFRLPRNVIFGAILTAVTIYILKMIGFEYYNELLLNAYTIFNFLFLINGIAFLDFLLKNNKISITFRVLIPIIIILFFNMSIIYSIFGIVDALFGLRRRIKQV